MWGKGVHGTHLEEALRPRLLFISALGPDESSFSTKEEQSGQEDERRGVVWGYSTESSSLENSREEENQISSIRLIKKLVKNRKIKSKCTEDDGGTLKT
jgi:hypothetical protein